MKTPFIQTFINSKNGKIILSVILGFGIATLFRESCKNRNCLIFHAPSIQTVKNKIFSYDNKCYTYIEKHAHCDANKKILDIHS